MIIPIFPICLSPFILHFLRFFLKFGSEKSVQKDMSISLLAIGVREYFKSALAIFLICWVMISLFDRYCAAEPGFFGKIP